MYLGGDVVGMYKSTDRGKNWSFINNGLNNYQMYGVAIAPSSPRTVYAMSLNGIVKTTDGGASWTQLPETFRGKLNISAKRGTTVRPIAIHPSNPGIVYAGSGEGNAYMTSDGGNSWTELDYRSTIAAPTASSVKPASGKGFLYASLTSPANAWKHHGRIERYYDKTQDWSAYKTLSASVYNPEGAPAIKAAFVIQSGADWKWQNADYATIKPGEWTEISFDLSGISDLANVHMVHVMFLMEGQAFKGEIGLDAVTLTPSTASGSPLSIGEWDSADSVEGWRASKSGDAPFIGAIRSSLGTAPAAKGSISSIVLDPAKPTDVYICHNALGVLKSTDSGKSWKRLETPTKASHIAFAKARPGTLYGAFRKDGVWKSSDSGATWTKCADLPADTEALELAVDPRKALVIHLIANRPWAGTYFRSDDGGATWKGNREFTRDLAGNPTDVDGDSNGKKTLSSTTNLAMSESDPETLLISANWNNIVSTDGGRSWRESSRGADITCFHDLRFADGQVFGAAMDEGTFTSADNGATWKQLWPRKYQEGESGHNWKVHAYKKDDGQFHIVSTVSPWRGAREYPNHLVVSDDSGKTFKHATGLPEVLPKKNAMWGDGYARALVADPNNPLVMYLGIDGDPEPDRSFAGGGVFKSIDGGYSWVRLQNQPGSLRMFYGLAVDPTDSNRLFWGAHGGNGGVWRSEDGGASWEHMNGPDSYLFNVEVTNDGTVYAGGNELWKSTDHGTTWQKLSNFTGREGSVVGIAWDPEDSSRIWFSSVTWSDSVSGGIYASEDGGKTWKDFTGDIPYRKPLVLRYNSDTKELWAAGVGAFKTKIPTTKNPAIKAGGRPARGTR